VWKQQLDPLALVSFYVPNKGKRVERRLRQANLCMTRMARAWDAMRRLYPKVVPSENPFRGVELEHGHGTTKPATREQAYALHAALIAAAEPHLAVVPLICFEWPGDPRMCLLVISHGLIIAQATAPTL
jgi:hypothetical protein